MVLRIGAHGNVATYVEGSGLATRNSFLTLRRLRLNSVSYMLCNDKSVTCVIYDVASVLFV